MSYANIAMNRWAVEDRPREKLKERGLRAMTNAELLAILLRSGARTANGTLSALDLGRKLLREKGGLSGLARADFDALIAYTGIGDAKAMTLMAAFELGRRKIAEGPDDALRVNSYDTAGTYLQNLLGDEEREVFHVMFLNRNNTVKGEKTLFRGGVSSTLVDAKVVFHEAVQHLASAIIVAHNHPSGSCTPSRADMQLTQQLKEAAKLLDISLLDHIIVTQHAYYSFAERGEL